MPAGEGRKEEEADEGEDDGDDAVEGRCQSCALSRFLERRLGDNIHQIRENNHILELRGEPDQIQRVLVDADLLRQSRGIVRAQPGAAVRVYADAKEADAGLQSRVARDALDLGEDGVVDLRCVWHWRVVVVVERQQEDVGY